MALTTKLPDAVQWSEGMLLSPQHFQQNDIYWQEHLRHRLQALTPHYWGVVHMRCNLIKETISISELECVLPDGLAVQFPGNFPRLPAGNLELEVGSKCVGSNPLRVWLWVRDRGTTAACSSDKERRYNSIQGPLIADENTGESNLAIERLQVCFELYIGASAPAGQCACPLLEVARDVKGLLSITKYHPPMLQLDGSAFQQEQSLTRSIDQLNEKLWAKVKALAGDCDDAQADQQNGQSEENRQHLKVARQLASCLPQLALSMEPQCHPKQLYQAVAQVVGQVAGIGPNPLPLMMKPYQHDDCMPQFQAAFEYIEAKLALVNTAYESLPFARFGEAGFARRLHADMGDHVIVELRPRDTQTIAQMRHWMSKATIASEHLMPHLLRTRLQGALVRHLTPQEIKQHKFRPHSALFLIKSQDVVHDKGQQPAFAAEQSLLIQGEPNADMPAAIILYRKKQTQQASPAKIAAAAKPKAAAPHYA